MNADEKQSLALAQKFFAAGQAHDIETMKTLINDDVIIWYNFNGLTLDRTAFIEFLTASYKSDMKTEYNDIKITPSSSGFVEEGILRISVGGKEHVAPFCLVGTIRDGKLSRVNEYFDSKDMPKVG